MRPGGAELIERLKGGRLWPWYRMRVPRASGDPGQRPVAAARGRGAVEPVPGACALVAALTASGPPTEEFHLLDSFRTSPGNARVDSRNCPYCPEPWCCMESPFRIQRLVEELTVAIPSARVKGPGNRPRSLRRDAGASRGVGRPSAERPRKGEFVVMVAPASGEQPRDPEEAGGGEVPSGSCATGAR